MGHFGILAARLLDVRKAQPFCYSRRASGAKKTWKVGDPGLLDPALHRNQETTVLHFLAFVWFWTVYWCYRSFHIRIYNPDSKAKPSLGPKNIFGTITSGCQNNSQRVKITSPKPVNLPKNPGCSGHVQHQTTWLYEVEKTSHYLYIEGSVLTNQHHGIG